MQEYTIPATIPAGYTLAVQDGTELKPGDALAKPDKRGKGKTDLQAPVAGTVHVQDGKVTIAMRDVEERVYEIPHTSRIRVENGKKVSAGDFLTEGSANPQEILRISGREAVYRYLIGEVQRVYRSQGVTINDKHIEIISRQMLRKVRIDQPGDSELLPTKLIDRLASRGAN